MRGIFAIWRSELWSYFNSLIAYIFILIFHGVAVGFYSFLSFDTSHPLDMRAFFFYLPFIFCIFIPAVTMRLWSEERKSGTIELLLTFPMRSWQLVLGKYLSALTFFLIALGVTLVVPIILGILGDPDFGPIIGGYIGFAFVGAMLLAMGMFISAFFKDQLVAFIITAALILFLVLAGNPWIAGRLDGIIRGLGQFLRSYVGMSDHIDGFERGVLDLRHILYFASYTVVFLILNALTLETFVRLQARLKLAAAGVLLLASAIVFNLLMGDISGARFDLTEGKLYTISDASKRILSRVKAPVKITYYVSARDKMPPRLQNIERDVTDFLRELSAGSERIQFSIVDPTDDAALVKTLKDKGIRREFGEARTDVTGTEINTVFNSIMISYLDKKDEVLNGLDPEGMAKLEYDLVSRILRLTLDETPKVALAAARRKMTQQDMMMKQFGFPVPPEDAYTLAARVLQTNGYDVSRITLTAREKIPDGIKTLLVFDMNSLDERQRWEINRFLRGGGNVVVCAQKYRARTQISPFGEVDIDVQSTAGNTNDLLAAAGLSLDDVLLMDEQAYTMIVEPFQLSLPSQILVLQQQMNVELSFANGVFAFFYDWGSRLNVQSKPGLKATWLAKTSPKTWVIPGRAGPPDPDWFDPAKNEKAGPQTVAVMVEGTFPDLFEGRERPAWPPEPPDPERPGMPEPPPPDDPPATPVDPKPGKLIAIGCGDMFDDGALRQDSHVNFLTNIVDALTIGEDITKIRAKVVTLRLIPKMTKGKRLTYQLAATGAVPLAFILAGVVRLVIRRRVRRRPYRA